jgi:hypothetical protein
LQILRVKAHLRATAALLFLLHAIACSDELGWTGTVTDSAGVMIVHNPEAGLWTAAERWTVEEELRVGALEGSPEYQFGQIGSIAVGSDGRIYVTDTQARHIRVFGPDGQYLLTIGGPGGGPGELGRNVPFVALTAGDTLIVPDRANRRVNRYAPDGAVLPDAPLRVELGRPVRYNLSPGGLVAAQLRLPGVPRMDVIVELESSGSFGDTLLEFPSGGADARPGEVQQFSPEPMWEITDSLTVLYGVNDEYRIGMYDGTGSLTRIVSRSYEPVPVTERDLRAFFAYLDRAWLAAGVSRSRLPELHSRTHFAEFYPAFMSLQLGYRGTIWVQRIQPPGGLTDEEIERYNFLEEFGSPDWDVFDPAGRFLGIVTLPARFQPRLFHGDRIYGVWRDDLDVQYVMRLRLVE